MPPIFLSDAKVNVTDSLPHARVWVVCLCADWCGLCREYRIGLQNLVPGLPSYSFAWLDIEDQADLVGDIDIETFPTLLVADAGGVLFFGPITPQAPTLTRLLRSLEDPAAKRRAHTAASQLLIDALPAHPQLHLTA